MNKLTDKNAVGKLQDNESADLGFTVKAISFEQLLAEYESTRPAKEYKPITAVEETVPVVIYAPGEEDLARPERPAPRKGAKRRPARPKSLVGVATVAAYVLFIFVFAIAALISPNREFSQKENRSLSRRPGFSLISVATGSFMSRMEAYLSDQFPGRDLIVSLKSGAERLFGSSEQNGVYIGSGGRLFEQQTGYDEKRVQNTVDAITAFSKSCGIKRQMFALAPNSSYVLADELPRFLSMDDQSGQIARVYEKLPQSMVCIDTASALMSYKNPQALYYKTDHHWTTRAAKLIFNEIAKQWQLDTKNVKYNYYTVSNSFCGTLASSSGIFDEKDIIEACIPHSSAGTYIVHNPDLQTKSTSLFEPSKLENQNQYEVFLGGNFSRLVISTTNRNSRSLLLFKDSYANCLLPMLTPYFQKIVVIDPRYFNENLGGVLGDAEYTHLLYLYNVNTFLEDNSLEEVLDISE